MSSKSILSVALAHIQDSDKSEITQVELLRVVSKQTGKSKESVRGTICKSSVLYHPTLLKKLGYYFERQPARLVRGEPKLYQSYNCPVKQQARQDIFAHVSNKKNPVIATFAGHEGLCVQHALKTFESPKIMNIEKDPFVMSAYKELGLPTWDFQTDVTNFLKLVPEELDLLYYDSVGYLSRGHAENCELINKNRTTKVLALAFIDIKNLRNTGAWVTEKRAQYLGQPDPTKQILQDILNNYDLTDEIKYKKSNKVQARGMRVFIFRLKEGV
jgi:hypothetical protein